MGCVENCHLKVTPADPQAASGQREGHEAASAHKPGLLAYLRHLDLLGGTTKRAAMI